MFQEIREFIVAVAALTEAVVARASFYGAKAKKQCGVTKPRLET